MCRVCFEWQQGQLTSAEALSHLRELKLVLDSYGQAPIEDGRVDHVTKVQAAIRKHEYEKSLLTPDDDKPTA